jgi:outer membrane protein OmpA-like peptidoglycan-associated protein
MNVKKQILSGLLLLAALTASAQESQQGETVYDFKPHWFLQVQPVGGQYTLGEVDFSHLASYNVQAALGYQFNKVVGLRLAVNAWQSKGGIEIDNSDFGQVNFRQTWKWNYVAPSLDLQFNLSNLLNYNPKRFFNLYAFVGAGVNFASSNDEAQDAEKALQAYLNSGNNRAWDGNQNMRYLWDGSKTSLFGQGGLVGDFRLSDAISLILEANANLLSDKYNSKKAGNADWYFNALAGLRINLGKTRSVETKDVYRDVVVYDTIYKYIQEPVIPQKEQIRRDVFFTINSTVITDAEMQKVKEIAEYLNKYPEAKVVVSGYADKGTGNERINARLAAQRADVVVNTLKKDYGIAENRITYDSYGDKVQPFEENDLNRVSICIAE